MTQVPKIALAYLAAALVFGVLAAPQFHSHQKGLPNESTALASPS
jgi:hypothetical protein